MCDWTEAFASRSREEGKAEGKAETLQLAILGMLRNGKLTISEIAECVGVNDAFVYKVLANAEACNS